MSPRCGSSMIAEAMSQTQALGYPLEWFNDAMQSGDPQLVGAPERCRRLVSSGVTPNGVAGVKIYAAQFKKASEYIDWEVWFPNTKWIRLRRRDVLRQAISLAIARQGGAWTSEEARKGSLSYDREQIEDCMKELTEENDFWDNYFVDMPHSPPVFWYEDVVHSLADAIDQIADYVGVKIVTKAPGADQTSLKRQADLTNEDWRARFLAGDGQARP
jgi:LPS sulfotransferase NodH